MQNRLGDYFGFGYAMADGGKGVNLEGDFLNLSANSLASDSTDSNLISYGNVDYNNSDESSWELGQIISITTMNTFSKTACSDLCWAWDIIS